MIADTVRYLKAHGRFVVYDAEHCVRRLQGRSRLCRWRPGRPPSSAGADIVTLLRHQRRIAARRRSRRSPARRAQPFAAGSASTRTTTSASASPTRWPPLDAGATHVQGTINGYGERTGNCNLDDASSRSSQLQAEEALGAGRRRCALLTELSQFVDETANLRPNPRLPWVGAAAFSHKGGTHVNAVQKVLRSYEHIDPALGRQHAGTSSSATWPAAATS